MTSLCHPARSTRVLFRTRLFTIINVKRYYLLTKPGIVRGNAITTAAGFLFASQKNINFVLLAETLFGISLIIASACVCNNYIDKDIDQKMNRTKKRALVTGEISGQAALIFGGVLGLVGFGVLRIWVNWLAALIAFLGWFNYVAIYSRVKRRTKYGTIIGSIPGATPPVVGYCAVTNQIDLAAVFLFSILVFWQMPHFYAIAIYRLKEYKSAHIPVWSIIEGVAATKQQIILFIIAFIVALFGFWLFNDVSNLVFAGSLFLASYWLWTGIKGFNSQNSDRWARQMFGISLLVITLFSILISVNAYLL